MLVSIYVCNLVTTDIAAIPLSHVPQSVSDIANFRNFTASLPPDNDTNSFVMLGIGYYLLDY